MLAICVVKFPKGSTSRVPALCSYRYADVCLSNVQKLRRLEQNGRRLCKYMQPSRVHGFTELFLLWLSWGMLSIPVFSEYSCYYLRPVMAGRDILITLLSDRQSHCDVSPWMVGLKFLKNASKWSGWSPIRASLVDNFIRRDSAPDPLSHIRTVSIVSWKGLNVSVALSVVQCSHNSD